MKRIYFDMDGTIADLYGVPDWETYLRNSDATPYRTARELVNMVQLECICEKLIPFGYEFGIITWLARNSSEEYDEQVISAKMDWAGDRMPFLSDFIAVPYGTPKHKVARRCKKMYLVDDNADVRNAWDTPKQRTSIDANGNIIEELLKIYREELSKERE